MFGSGRMIHRSSHHAFIRSCVHSFIQNFEFIYNILMPPIELRVLENPALSSYIQFPMDSLRRQAHFALVSGKYVLQVLAWALGFQDSQISIKPLTARTL